MCPPELDTTHGKFPIKGNIRTTPGENKNGVIICVATQGLKKELSGKLKKPVSISGVRTVDPIDGKANDVPTPDWQRFDPPLDLESIIVSDIAR